MAVQAWYEGLQQLDNALPVPARFTDAPWPGIPARARLLWALDGVEWVDTVATAWTASAVLVDVLDGRWQLNAAWLPVDSVRRRDQTSTHSSPY